MNNTSARAKDTPNRIHLPLRALAAIEKERLPFPGAGEVADVLGILPADLRALWPETARPAGG